MTRAVTPVCFNDLHQGSDRRPLPGPTFQRREGRGDGPGGITQGQADSPFSEIYSKGSHRRGPSLI